MVVLGLRAMDRFRYATADSTLPQGPND